MVTAPKADGGCQPSSDRKEWMDFTDLMVLDSVFLKTLVLCAGKVLFTPILPLFSNISASAQGLVARSAP
jgi:hypothetical protein